MNKKLGYYLCDGQEFESKIHCYLHASKNNSDVQWIFNNSEFDSYNFSHEPEQSLDELYNRRARELRERYDYLVLSYSGGADSHNILMSFYRQGLHIDEVVTNWFFEATSNFVVEDTRIQHAWNQNAEYALNTRAKLDWISTYMPRTKITVWDCTRDVITYYLKAKDPSWVLDAKDTLNPAGHQRFNYFHVKELRKTIDAELNVGVVIGTDKPICIIEDGKMYLHFTDKFANNTPVNNSFLEYTNSTNEFFYWSPDSRDIIAKQCHTILRFLNANPGYRAVWNNQEWFFRDTKERILRTIIYTTWEKDWFQVSKPTKDWDCEFDSWFFNGPQFRKAKENWDRGLNYLLDNIDGLGRGFAPMYTPKYYIGDINN
jgi:hypothetical protein